MTVTVVDAPARRCAVETCERPVRAKGLCASHYNRARLNQPLDPPFIPQRIGVTAQELIRARTVVTDAGCWEFTGPLHPSGYARFAFRSRTQAGHRLSYEAFVGPIPQGLQIDHLCRNRACLNPEHLEPVTARENVMRSTGISARNAAKTHCKRGHEFTPENTYFNSHGGRGCKACINVRLDAATAERPAPEHGTVSRYRRWGCRCTECRARMARHAREMNAGRKARAKAASQ